MPKLKYHINTDDRKFLMSLAGHQLRGFRYNSENPTVMNYASSKVLEILYSGVGSFLFMKKNLVQILNINFPIIREQEFTSDLCSVLLESNIYDKESFLKRQNLDAIKLKNNRVVSITDIPTIERIEIYNISCKNYIYEAYDVERKSESYKIIDFDIDVFLAFYLSNGDVLHLMDNKDTNGCSIIIQSVEEFKTSINSLKKLRYKGFNLKIKEGIS